MMNPRSFSYPSRVRACFCSILVAVAAGGCTVKYGDLGDYDDTEGEASTGGESTTTATSTETSTESASSGSSSTGEPMCVPGETMEGLCGNYCQCEPNGTWACSDKGCVAIGPGFEQTVEEVGGCADMEVYASGDDGQWGLHVVAPGLVKEAKAAGVAIEKTLPITDASLTAEVLTSGLLTGLFCNDVMIETSIELTYVPIAGTVTFTVTPIDGPDPASATATAVFEDVVWKIKDVPESEPVPMGPFSIDMVAVGWLPG